MAGIYTFFSVFLEHYGYHNEKTANEQTANNTDKYQYPSTYTGDLGTLTGLNIIGYLPVVSIGSAIYRWRFAVKEYDQDNLTSINLIGHIVRGIFEFLGAGLAIGLLVDLPVSLHRHKESLFPCSGRRDQ